MKTLAFVSSLSVLVFVAKAQWRRIGTNSLEASLVYEGVNSQVQDRLVMNELWEAYKRRVSRVKSGKFGHQKNSATHLQTV